MRPATTRTRARAATACPSGPRTTAPSRTPTSSSGTPSGTRTSRGPRKPVMPAAYIGFMLKPTGFFAENPGNDIPPSMTPPAPGPAEKAPTGGALRPSPKKAQGADLAFGDLVDRAGSAVREAVADLDVKRAARHGRGHRPVDQAQAVGE